MDGALPANDERLLELLWRGRTSRAPRRGRPPRISAEQVIAAGIGLADAGGAESLTMRAIAARVGTAPMTLYGHVPDKGTLLALMHDAVLLGMPVSEPPQGASWRDRLRLVASDNRALYRRHPWLLETRFARPPIGPGMLAKYEWELSALDGMGLSDRTVDSSLGYLLDYVRASVEFERRQQLAARQDAQRGPWWARVAPTISRVVTQAEFGLASRIGDGADDPEHAYRFGLDRVLDGIATLVPARFRV